MLLPKLSPITKAQIISIVKNSVIAGLAAFVATVQVSGLTKAGAISGLSVALAAIVKTVEKAFTEG
jgi:hypothetical protein